jgi:hypothetical protein
MIINNRILYWKSGGINFYISIVAALEDAGGGLGAAEIHGCWVREGVH